MASRFASFRAVLFRMVSKRPTDEPVEGWGFRAVLFRMVSKQDFEWAWQWAKF